ncbi:MAG TPA: hypothetical protein VFE16_13225 [Candidatus Cybelea sp.]|jgi:hypothetical protein|nr:hypothetical protein [Candidatus Cybelea sp.]
MRALMAAALVGTAALAFFRRNLFGEITGYFTRVAGRLTWMDRARLQRVIEARQRIETVPSTYTRVFAAIALVLAPLEFSPAVPFIVPYATMAVAMAFGMLGVYALLCSRWNPRAAALVRRSVLAVLPAPMLAALTGSFLATLALASTPGQRFGGIAVALALLVMAAVAWRIAVAPTLLLGIDPEWEYVVDERLRVGRARAIVVLACITASLFATEAARAVAAGSAEWIPLLAGACTLIAIFENARVQWQGLHPA